MERIWQKAYDLGVPATIEIPNETMEHALTRAAQDYPEQTALIFYNNKISYADLDAMVDNFASALQANGFQKGDRVSLYLPNCPQYVIGYYGTLRAGGIVVPTNPLYVPREIAHQINDSGATFMVSLGLMYDRVKKVRSDLGLKKLIVANIKDYFPPVLKVLFSLLKENKPDMNGERHRVDFSGDADTVSFMDFLREGQGKKPASVEVKSEDTAILMYTGGTTGVPKGAQLTHQNVIANVAQSAAWIPSIKRGKGTVMSALPLTHSYGMTACQNLAIYLASAQVLIPNPRDLADLLKNLTKHKVVLFPGVPTLYNAVNNYPDVKAGKYDLSSIEICLSGAAGLPPEVQKEFMNLTGSKLVEAYGLSETSPAACINPVESTGKIGTIGVPISSTDIKIVDAEIGKKDLPIGEVGELCIKGPQVMKGYWHMPTETANVLRPDENGDVWLHTGDLAVMDEDGFFRIVDRKKDMIISGGFNIYPNEVEYILYQHPAILEAAVVGIPHETRGEVAKAFVVLKEGESLTEDELRAWCKQEMRAYMVPKSVQFKDELPKTMVGKILRRVLVDEELGKAAE